MYATGFLRSVCLSVVLFGAVGAALAQPVPEPCCLPDGMCLPLLPTDCQQLGGYLPPSGMCLGDGNGNGVDDACEQIMGACCLPGGACIDMDPNQCIMMGGFLSPIPCMGDLNSNGIDDACEGTIEEACCLPDGTCIYLPPDICNQQGGFFPPEGYCKGDLNSNGIDDACELEAPEACCTPDGRCHMELPNSCLQQGGVPQGPGTICMGDPNGNGVDEACESLPLKFIQRPDINRTGIDVKATAPNILADDFLCQRRSLITDITVWGSWKNDLIPTGHMVSFTLSIHKNSIGAPGEVVWTRTFQPGEFTASLYLGNLEEYWWDPFTPQGWIFPGDTQCWQYDFHIPVDEAFCQQGGPDEPLVYWLDVQAQPMGTAGTQFGWKTVTSPPMNFGSAAVAGQGTEPYTGPWTSLAYPMPGHVWQGEAIGLAFSISGDEPCPEQEPREYGDAPEGVLAYPATGMIGQFPTCKNVGPPLSYIEHNNFGAWFGPAFDFEMEGNAGLCPVFNPNLYDQDECWQDGDAGLMHPPAYTIQGPVGAEQVVPCTGIVGALGQVCQQAFWGPNIDTQIVNNMPNQTQGYVNVLMDWDQSGTWGGAAQCPTAMALEHVLVDWPVPPNWAGPLSALGPPGFLIGPNAGYVWTRITITERPLGAGWTGSGVFEDGETEDYLLEVHPGVQEESDFGDAPDPTYPTLLASLGAQHLIVPGIMLGNLIDAEPDGQPTVNADGDDLANLPDEDGVMFMTPLIAGQAATVQVIASVPGTLWAWIDFDVNGSWAEAADQIANGLGLNPGPNVITFMVPATAQPGVTYARFRFTTMAGVVLSYTGSAPDGEVEDYLVMIEEAEPMHDLGDAPDSSNSWGVPMFTYPVGVLANFPTVYQMGSPPFGPLHRQPRAIGWLGQAVTLENEADLGPDQDPTNNLIPPQNLADLDGADDGVQMPICLPHCRPTTFTYTVTMTGLGPQMLLNAWFDWNRDGDWDDVLTCPDGTAVPEWAVQNLPVPPTPGPGTYTFVTPPFVAYDPVGTVDSPPIWMRVTLAEQPWQPGAMPGWGGSGPAGGYDYGETEDYLFEPPIIPPPPVVTLAASRKTHGVGGSTFDTNPCAGDTEPRIGGPTKVVVTFNQPIVQVTGTVADVTVSSGVVTLLTVAGPVLTIDMNGAANAQPLIIRFPGIQSALPCGQLSQGGVCIRVLTGDVNNDGKTNVLDLVVVRNNLNLPAGAANFRADVNADGTINVLDLVQVRNNLNLAVGPCPGAGCW